MALTRRLLPGLFGVLLIAPGICPAQEPAAPGNPTIEELRNELLQIRHELDSLKTVQAALTPVQEDDLDRMEDHLVRRIQELENKIDAVSRATAPTVLNPKMTAFINFAARGDNKTVHDQVDSTKEISSRPYLRTLEVEMLSAVDPYAEAVSILSVENEAGRDFAVDAEEAYGLIKRLPVLESAPLGMKLKIGKYRAPFGVNNMIHLHDLPWTTRPLIVSKYLGTDHGNFFESGFNPTGLDLNFYLPNPIPQTTLEMNLDAVRAGDIALAAGQSGSQPALLGHVTWSKDWANEHLLVLGASAYQENGSSRTRLVGADVTYKWAPVEQRESHSFVAGGEFMSGSHTLANQLPVAAHGSPYGWFGYLQYQTSYWVYLGVRYDWLKEPVDDRLITRSVSGYLSYYTTEFLRFRVGLEHTVSDVPAENGLTTGLLEVNFVFGSHPTEPYWVNK